MKDYFWIALSPFIALFLMVVLLPVGVAIMVYALIAPFLALLAERWPWFNRLLPPKLR